MKRKDVLDRLIKGPVRNVPIGTPLTWRFESSYRKGALRRVFFLYFDVVGRKWGAIGYRRVSKRKKRRAVTGSAAIPVYLRSRLSPQDIAHCTAAAIAESVRNDFDDLPF